MGKLYLVITVRRLDAIEGQRCLGFLAEVLVDCVEGGASVSFMPPFQLEAAKGFFESVIKGVAVGERVLIAAFDGANLVGTVQLVIVTPPNQPHRADVAKLLVRRSARRRGVAKLLMEYVEEVARQEGKSLLVLDTGTGGAAERLYTHLGWTRVGVVPKYALYPDGTWCDTTFFWKEIASP